jgi:dolichol-phosphate mannosyltransferase
MIPDISWSVAIMCYNEASTLRDVVIQTNQVLSSITDDYEIVIIDDGSTDGSGEIADQLKDNIQRARVVHHDFNQGIGEVLRTAYREARKDWISIVPSDKEFDPSDLIVGYQLLEEGTVIAFTLTKLPPIRRRIVSALQRLLNFLLFNLKVSRVNWVKIIPVKALRESEFISRSPAIETEVLVRLKKQGYRILEVPSNNDIRLGRAGGMSTRYYLGAIWASFLESIAIWRSLRGEFQSKSMDEL